MIGHDQGFFSDVVRVRIKRAQDQVKADVDTGECL